MGPEKLKRHREQVSPVRRQWARHRSVLRYQFRHVPEGIDGVVAVLQSSAHDGIKRFVEAYIDLTATERRKADLDALAVTCQVTPGEVIGEYAHIGFDQGWDVARGIAGARAPALMDASMRLAARATKDGSFERRMHMTASGYLPTPSRGVSIRNQMLQLNAAAKSAPEELTGLPDIVTEQRAISERVREVGDRLLEDTTADEEV